MWSDRWNTWAHQRTTTSPSLLQVLTLDGSVLHLLMQLKENYFGAWQEYVDMEAQAPPPERPAEGAFDPRCFRPLDVRATVILHDMHGHLMKVSCCWSGRAIA